MSQEGKSEKKTKTGMNRSSRGWRGATKAVRKGRRKAKELTASARRSLDKAGVKGSAGAVPLEVECEESPTGLHEPLPFSISPAPGLPMTVDIGCKHCSTSGSATIDPNQILW